MSVSCSHIEDGFQIRHPLKNKHITGCSIPLMGLSLLSLPILNFILLPQLGVRKCSWGGYGCETNPWDLETLKRQIQTQAIGGCSSGQVHPEPRDSQWCSKGAFGAQVPEEMGRQG